MFGLWYLWSALVGCQSTWWFKDLRDSSPAFSKKVFGTIALGVGVPIYSSLHWHPPMGDAEFPRQFVISMLCCIALYAAAFWGTYHVRAIVRKHKAARPKYTASAGFIGGRIRSRL